MQQIRDVMTPDPITLAATATLVEGSRAMRDNAIGDVLVLADQRLCGVVTDRDIVTRALADSLDPTTTVLGDICTAEVVTVRPDDTVDDATQLMRTRAIRRLPVVDETGMPIGVVTLGDLAVEYDAKSALADISAAPPTS
ncbi:MAG TPA: CBS domain-containing protein [Actinomycetes bacterium]|nr:CBS domain-containing protein [Actinomycetes bacterium]